jgi:sigma-B regulation protein RsbU (phosphoserine phosphatase)
MNRLLHVSTDSASYATFFYAQFDEETNLLTYVNAGHNPPMLIRTAATVKVQSVGFAGAGARHELVSEEGDEGTHSKSDVRLLTTGGPIIGAFSDCVYEQETIKIQSGDLLVAYTDGVTEARNADDQEFGESRLRQVIDSSMHLPTQELTRKIVQSVGEWCGDVPPHDDLTLVVMKVK